MAEIWYPLLYDPADLSRPYNIVPDWANDKIYHYSFDSKKIWTSDITDGTLLATKTVAAICGISSNDFIVSPSIVLGTDGSHIYAMTSAAGGAGKRDNLRLSKIDTATMAEVAAVVPYAITNRVLEGYSIINAGDWRLVAFKLNGTDYLALLLNGSNPANIEIFDTAALSSVITFNFLTQNATSNWMVVGEQPSGTSQKLYLMQEDPNGVDQQIGFVAVTFTTTPTISDALIVNLLATDIDPAWTGADVNFVDTDPLDLMFCSTDSSLVFAVLNDVSAGPNLPPLTKVVKVNSSTGAVEWTVTVSDSIFSLFNSQFAQGSILSDLSCCTLVFCDPNSTTYYVINLPAGTFTSGTSTYFDGTVADPGVRMPAVWDSVRQRLIYYYEGTNHLSVGWPFGGWAIWGPDGDLGCCSGPPPLAGSGRGWLAKLGPVRELIP